MAELANAAFVLPYPFSHFIAANVMTTIPFAHNIVCEHACVVFKYLEQWKLHMIHGLDDPSVDEPADGAIFDRVVLRRIRNQLCIWVPAIMAHSQDAEVERVVAEEFVTYIDRAIAFLDHEAQRRATWLRTDHRGGYWNVHVASHGRYCPAYLWHCLKFFFQSGFSCTSAGENGDNHQAQALKVLMEHAMNLLPPGYREVLIEVVKESEYPSRSTLIRARLCLDVSFMRYMADIHEADVGKGSIALGLLDSSPQGGRNWLIMEYFMLDGARLCEVLDAVLALKRFPREPPFLEHQLSLMDRCVDIIFAALRHHIGVPVVLHSRHTNLPNKGYAVMHSFRLESNSWRLVQGLVSLFFAWSSDRGQEKGLRTVRIASPYSYFQWWTNTLAPGDGDEAIGDVPQDDDCEINFNGSFIAPGTFHIVENMVKTKK